jgi:glycosyltransferase involved in cell wall biosynthesis
MSKPRLSVVIPCYNHGAYLPEAIESVQSAKREDIETIVVDDGSTDPLTREVVSKLKGERLTVIQQKNSGLAAARNIAIRAAKADYILPLDADNRIRPAYIAQGISILDANPKAGVVYGDSQYFGAKSGVYKTGLFDLERIMEWNYIDACAVLRRAVWEQHGGYDGKMPVMGLEDWDMWLGAASRGWELVYVPEVLFDYRVMPGSMLARSHADMEKTERYMAQKYGLLYREAFRRLRQERRSLSSTAKVLAGEMKNRLPFKSPN